MTAEDIEMERIKLERDRLDFEKSIERERMDFEKDKAKSDQKFLNRNSGIIISAAVSFAAVVVSIAQVWNTRTPNQTEINVATEQKESEIKVQELRNENDSRLNQGKLIFENLNKLIDEKPEQKAIAKIALVWSLTEKNAPEFVSIVKRYGPEGLKLAALDLEKIIEEERLNEDSNIKIWIGKWTYTFSGY